jgi:hypothetical protein
MYDAYYLVRKHHFHLPAPWCMGGKQKSKRWSEDDAAQSSDGEVQSIGYIFDFIDSICHIKSYVCMQNDQKRLS